MNLTLDYIARNTGGKILNRNTQPITSISTDSRHLKSGALFLALAGENFDGHDFIPHAIQQGAAAVVVSKLTEEVRSGGKTGVVVVPDTLVALQNLAAQYRAQFQIPVVAVTGSVGKTTTKDILAGCLNQNLNTLKTSGNFNNEIGLPLTLLGLEPEHKAAVVEMGMRSRGEIAKLALIAQPTCAIITNVEPVHLETMGSLENIALAKCEVLENLKADDFAILNGDNDLLLKTARPFGCKKYTFGTYRDCDIEILTIKGLPTGIDIGLRVFDEKDNFYFPVPAPELAGNVAAAVGAARLLGVSLQDIKAGIKDFSLSQNRLQIIELAEGGKAINDTYNANPLSVLAALQLACTLDRKARKVAVLGDMLELGAYEIPGHIKVGKRAAELGIDVLVTIGERSAHTAKAALEAGMSQESVKHFLDRDECLAWLRNNVSKREIVLFKASRMMQLETLLNDWMS
jgi:UDP-N-acetylmuramoyl-tripeptide--D-alanyl-D-alanine ligase